LPPRARLFSAAQTHDEKGSDMNTPTPEETLLGLQTPAPAPRRFFTPLSCCLGCGGLLVLVFLGLFGAAYWLTTRLFPDAPLAIDMPVVDPADTQRALQKCEALARGDLAAAEFPEPELNAVLRRFLTEDFAKEFDVDPAQCKGRIEITPDDRIKLAVSVPLHRDWARFINVEFLGKLVVDNFQLRVTDAEVLRIGRITVPDEHVKGAWKQKGNEATRRIFGSVEKRLKTLEVAGGRLRIALSDPPQNDPPQNDPSQDAPPPGE